MQKKDDKKKGHGSICRILILGILKQNCKRCIRAKKYRCTLWCSGRMPVYFGKELLPRP